MSRLKTYYPACYPGLIARLSLFWYLWIVAWRIGDCSLWVCVCVHILKDGTWGVISNWPETPPCLIWEQTRTHLQAEYWVCEHPHSSPFASFYLFISPRTHRGVRNESNARLWKRLYKMNKKQGLLINFPVGYELCFPADPPTLKLLCAFCSDVVPPLLKLLLLP